MLVAADGARPVRQRQRRPRHRCAGQCRGTPPLRFPETPRPFRLRSSLTSGTPEADKVVAVARNEREPGRRPAEASIVAPGPAAQDALPGTLSLPGAAVCRGAVIAAMPGVFAPLPDIAE